MTKDEIVFEGLANKVSDTLECLHKAYGYDRHKSAEMFLEACKLSCSGWYETTRTRVGGSSPER